MPLTVAAAVVISAEPAALDETHSCPATVFPVAELDTAVEPVAVARHTTRADIAEVICRGTLAALALQHLHLGHQIVVTGELTLTPSLDRSPDTAAVLLAIEATDIGISISGGGAL